MKKEAIQGGGIVWHGGLGRDEVVRPVAQEASAEVMVAGVGCGRKKKEEEKVAEERKGHGGCSATGEELG